MDGIVCEEEEKKTHEGGSEGRPHRAPAFFNVGQTTKKPKRNSTITLGSSPRTPPFVCNKIGGMFYVALAAVLLPSLLLTFFLECLHALCFWYVQSAFCCLSLLFCVLFFCFFFFFKKSLLHNSSLIDMEASVGGMSDKDKSHIGKAIEGLN